MIKRRYLITFCMGTENENNFVAIVSDCKEVAFGKACMLYGFSNVGGVYVDNKENRNYFKMRGYTELKK